MCSKKIAGFLTLPNGNSLRGLCFAAAGLATVTMGAQPTLTVLPTHMINADQTDGPAFDQEIGRAFQGSSDARYVAPDASALKDVGAEQGCDDRECAIQAGRVMGVSHVVYPSVRKVDGKWIMNLSMVDALSGESVESKSGLSTSETSAAAASDFSTALTEPLTTALHEEVTSSVAYAGAAAPAAVASTPSYSSAPAAETPAAAAAVETPAPTPAPAVAADEPSSFNSASTTATPAEEPAPVKDHKTRNRILIAVGGVAVVGAAVAVLVGSGSSSSSSSSSNGGNNGGNNGGGNGGSTTSSVTVAVPLN